MKSIRGMLKERSTRIGIVLGVVWIAILLSRPLALQASVGEPTLVDGRLSIGQSKESFLSFLPALGYMPSGPSAEMEPDEVTYSLPANENGTYSFLRVSYQNGVVRKLSGRSRTINCGNKLLILDRTTRDEVLGFLGKPSWEASVGIGNIGMCYKSIDLYLVLEDGKIVGFSLGDVPTKPAW